MKTKKQLMRMNEDQLEIYFRENCTTVMSSLGYSRGENEWYAHMDMQEAMGEYFHEKPNAKRYEKITWHKKEDMIDFFMQYEKKPETDDGDYDQVQDLDDLPF